MATTAQLAFDEPDQFAASVRGARLKCLVTARGQYQADATRINFDQLWIQRTQQSLPYVAHIAGDRSRNVVIFYDGGQPSLQQSGTELLTGDLIVDAFSSEQYLRTTTDSRCGSLSLTSDTLADACVTLAGREPAPRQTMRIARPAVHRSARLMALHKAATDLAAMTPEVLRHPRVATAMENALVQAMVACLAEDGAGTDSGRSVLSSTIVMQRFEQILEARAGEPLYLVEVCRSLNVTDRTLRAHCQEHLGMSPHRYLVLRRMHLARGKLRLADRTNTTVAKVANDCGFGELGRFAVAYRALFNESPSKTLRREPVCAEWQAARPSELESGFA